MSGFPSALQKFWPGSAVAVRDAYAVGQYEQLAAQIPLLYAALTLIVIAATVNSSPEAPGLIRYGIPFAVIATIGARSWVWMRRPSRGLEPADARAYVRGAAIVSGGIAAISSIWCYFRWLDAPASIALYFPLFTAMGSLATIG